MKTHSSHRPADPLTHPFCQKHAAQITGVLSCFDRIIFKGYLPFCQPGALAAFPFQQGVLLKDFKPFAQSCSDTLKEHAQQFAKQAGRPYLYLNRSSRKEEQVAALAAHDQITEGLICVLATVEQCPGFQLRYGASRPQLVRAAPRCLCVYFYFMDRQFGQMHVRLQTWFPFVIQVYLNGHTWLGRQLDRHQISYQALDNAFVALTQRPRVHRMADRLADQNWPRILGALAKRVNPLLAKLLAGLAYYWVIDQAEYPTDILFEDRAALKGLYPQLLRHATVCFSAEDVMTFLGRKLNGNFGGAILTDLKERWQGARVKHRLNGNWIKMYDKHGCVLRIETVINQPKEFRVRRHGRRQETEVRLVAAALRGEHRLNGFRNRDVASGIGLVPLKDRASRKRQSACVSRQIQLLRAHGLVAKVPHARRYRLTLLGAAVMTAVVASHHQQLPAALAVSLN